MEEPEYLHLAPEGPLPELDSAPFKAVLVIEREVPLEWEAKVCAWLIKSGCRYMMAWGLHCDRWHDSVDLANVLMFKGEEIPENDFVMTTWHQNEPLREAFWFCGNCASHPTLELEKAYIVQIAPEARGPELIAQYLSAQEVVD